MATGDADQIEEERRLLYVACTRARRHLYVLHPLRYYVKGRRGDAHTYSQLTRFIPCELKSFFQLDRRALGKSQPKIAASVRVADIQTHAFSSHKTFFGHFRTTRLRENG
jgi:ATP-dependent exoDNAse (exonuclease V) beta subunit